MATYRIQLNRSFDFEELKNIIPYLSQLGISHIYSSPILKARRGSTHGYDVTDPAQINDELGGTDAFEDLSREVAAYGLEWLQDIVPNHMSYSSENKMITDIMERGTSSKYHGFFDVDWNYPSSKLRGRILAPFLEHSYKECLKRGQIELTYNEGFALKYQNMEFPLKLSSYESILSEASPAVAPMMKNDRFLKRRLQERYRMEKTTGRIVKDAVRKYNGDTKLLGKLVSSQIFDLEHWTTALKQINYRRFSDTNELICLRMEKPLVFELTHRLILKHFAEGKMSGFRIDHIDGLYDPEAYLERLRRKAPDAYIIVEKILMKNETLPYSWPVQGSTGYDFLNRINELFIDRKNERNFDAVYREFTGQAEAYNELVYKRNKDVIKKYFGGDLKNVTQMFNEALKRKSNRGKFDFPKLETAIMELISCFPVYRTYVNKVAKMEPEPLRTALSLAKQKNKKVKKELIALENLLDQDRNSRDALHCLMRLQQLTGSVVAKGVEDTVLYIYNRLLSLNEVGGDPSSFGCEINDFHEFNKSRRAKWSFSMNSTGTHDTKRGEDVRARLNVLSEVPSQFRLKIKRWTELNLNKKEKIGNTLVPSRNEEYFVYQTLIGAFPFHQTEIPEFTNRLKNYMVKAVREAKINSTWLSPNLAYEEATISFVSKLLDQTVGNEFLQEFLSFEKEIAFYGYLNSIGQTLLKIACPGIPDFYQGSELWDLNLVDPDNRRPVDFFKRKKLLNDILNVETPDLKRLLENFQDGRVKLYAIHKLLGIRRKNRKLFEHGAYIPLTVKGPNRKHLVSFCRRKDASSAIAIIPRFLTNLTTPLKIPPSDVWKDTYISLPTNAPGNWREVFTNKTVYSKMLANGKGLYMGELLETFPAALLLSDESSESNT